MEMTLRSALPANQQQPDRFWDRAREAALKLLAEVDRSGAEISLLVVDDAGIRTLNREWRSLDRATDVLSWPLDEPLPALSGEDCLGDVAISLETAARQAAARGWALEDEAALLLIHGILHLLGHEDDTEAGSEGMRRIETRILGRPLDSLEADIPPLSDRNGAVASAA